MILIIDPKRLKYFEVNLKICLTMDLIAKKLPDGTYTVIKCRHRSVEHPINQTELNELIIETLKIN